MTSDLILELSLNYDRTLIEGTYKQLTYRRTCLLTIIN